MKGLLVCLMMALMPAIWLYAETYDLRFANASVDWTAEPPEFCLDLQIKAADAQPDFRIGSHTVFFSYNNAAIDTPYYQSLAFNNLDSCAVAGMVAPYNAPSFSYNSGGSGGNGNLTTIMDFSGFGCPVLTDTAWIDMGIVCFEIIDATQPTNIVFDAGVTQFNLNNDNPSHTLGTVLPFDTILLDIPDGLEAFYGGNKAKTKLQAYPNPVGDYVFAKFVLPPRRCECL